MVLAGNVNEEVENDQNKKQENETKTSKGIILSEEELYKIAGGSNPENPEKE